METLARLEQVILQRRECDPSTSYVANLRQQGRECMAQKLGEEAIEIAVRGGDAPALEGELARTISHLAGVQRVLPVGICVEGRDELGVGNRLFWREDAGSGDGGLVGHGASQIRGTIGTPWQAESVSSERRARVRRMAGPFRRGRSALARAASGGRICGERKLR